MTVKLNNVQCVTTVPELVDGTGTETSKLLISTTFETVSSRYVHHLRCVNMKF